MKCEICQCDTYVVHINDEHKKICPECYKMENIISWFTNPEYTKCFAYVYFPFIIAGIIWLWRMDGSIPKPKKKDKK